MGRLLAIFPIFETIPVYLDFAELQALNRNPMYMKDWISKLDDFLKVTTARDILSHAGSVSHHIALDKAQAEYRKYQDQLKSVQLSLVEEHFLKAIESIEQIEQNPKK